MYSLFFKRLIDLIAALMLMLLFSPILGFLFILVKLESPGPFFFIQARIGRNLKEFKIVKIRTMNAEACIRANDRSQKYITTQKNDARLTKLGPFLRKAHLDELPQLINVVLGQMSFIGVRPDAPSQVNDYSSDIWQERHKFRPGITGLSQVHSADANFNFSARLKYDLHYVRNNRKFFLDIYIIYRTFLKLKAMSGS